MNINDLPVWEMLLKKMLLPQLSFVSNMRVLDFGSGNGFTADYFAANNEVVAVEPSGDMLADRVCINEYVQLRGSIEKLRDFSNGYFDVIFCHNVLEYADDREIIVKEFYRLLKPGGKLSVVKHNRFGRVMQMVVLLNNFEHANELLSGKNGVASKFGAINYYDDNDIVKWCGGFRIKSVKGLRTFWDLQQNQEIQKNPDWQKNMIDIEAGVSDIDEFKAVAFFHHIIFEKGQEQ